ncbi:hypothetical protein BKA93DRAFT_589421 [Sparassis latifolia]
MVDWRSPDVIYVSGYVFSEVSVFTLGLYSWDFIMTLHHVEWPLVTCKLKFHWAYIPYILARHTTLAFLLSLVIITCSASADACPGGLKVLAMLGNLAVAGASTNLFIRTRTLWQHKYWVQIVLSVLSVGQWIVAFTVSMWNITNDLPTCGPANAHSTVEEIFIFYVYTAFFDMLILAMTVLRLFSVGEAHGSPLWVRLYRQGIWYFVTALLVGLIILVFAGLNLNPVMNIIFTVPGIVISVIASSRAVISLTKLKEAGCTNAGTHSQNATATISIGRVNQFTTNIELNSSLYDHPPDLEAQAVGKAVLLASPAPVTLSPPDT